MKEARRLQGIICLGDGDMEASLVVPEVRDYPRFRTTFLSSFSKERAKKRGADIIRNHLEVKSFYDR